VLLLALNYAKLPADFTLAVYGLLNLGIVGFFIKF